jgi:uncharacterized coiled-coil protein SlyX
VRAVKSLKQWYIATLKFAERTNEIMDTTISDDHNAYYNLSELSEALNQQHGTMISRSTLSRMVTKGLLKPDLTTSKEVLFLKSRLSEIAEAINNIRQTKSQEYQEIVKEEQQPPPPQLEPIVITQAPTQKQIPDITTLNLTEEILAKLHSLEKQVQDQQLEIQQLKMQIANLEKDCEKDYNKIRDYCNELKEVVNSNAKADRILQDQVRENFEHIEHEINQIRTRLKGLV